jgi:multiple sugar transport system substrate-binding protein
MTPNETLLVMNKLRGARPDDYDQNTATIALPSDVAGRPLVLFGEIYRVVVLKSGRDPALASDFARFLAEDGSLAHWPTFAGDRYLPPMRKLVEQPFWLDVSDPHRMRVAIQIMTLPHQLNRGVPDKDWQSQRVWDEHVWGNAVHRVVADGITPEHAVDDAIARIKQILSE